MDLSFSSVILCLYTLLTCMWAVGLVYWITAPPLQVCG